MDDDVVLRDKILCIFIANEGKEMTKKKIHDELLKIGIKTTNSKINNILFNQLNNLTTHTLEKRICAKDSKPKWVMVSKANDVQQRIGQMIYILLCKVCPHSRSINEIIEYVRSQIVLIEDSQELNTFVKDIDETNFSDIMYKSVQSCLSINETLNVNHNNEFNITYVNRRIVLIYDKNTPPKALIDDLVTLSTHKEWVVLYIEYADKQIWGSDQITKLPSFNTRTSHTFNITRIMALEDIGISYMLGALLAQYETHHIHFFTKNEWLIENVQRVASEMKFDDRITISNKIDFQSQK